MLVKPNYELEAISYIRSIKNLTAYKELNKLPKTASQEEIKSKVKSVDKGIVSMLKIGLEVRRKPKKHFDETAPTLEKLIFLGEIDEKRKFLIHFYKLLNDENTLPIWYKYTTSPVKLSNN